MDLLSKGVGGFRGDSLLRGWPPDNLRPKACLSGLLELVAYCVDYPVCKQAEEEVGIRPVVLLVMYWTQVQVGFQLAVGTLYLTSKIIIVPCGLLVKREDIRLGEINAAMLVHVLWHG